MLQFQKMYTMTINKFEPMSDSKANFINFGDLRLSKKGRNSLVITGSFSIFKNIGNEYKVLQ